MGLNGSLDWALHSVTHTSSKNCNPLIERHMWIAHEVSAKDIPSSFDLALDGSFEAIERTALSVQDLCNINYLCRVR